MDSDSPLYLIDGYGLIYRFYFAFLARPIKNSRGENVSALLGFARTLVALLENSELPGGKRPALLAAVFDSRTPTFRHKMYPDYKATRQKTPEDLHTQVPLVEETLAALGVPALRVDGYEADDIIATLATRCKKEVRPCYILSSDKDLLQLVGDGVFQMRPKKSAAVKNGEEGVVFLGGTAWDCAGPEKVKEEWQVTPDRIIDILSLIGDSSDNVPGVKGIGSLTASKLMARWGSLDGIYQNIAAIEGAVGKKLAAGKENAYFARKLIALDCDVPLPIKKIEDLSVEKINRKAGAQVLLREGILLTAKHLDPEVRETQDGQKASARGRSSKPDAGKPDSALAGSGVYKTVLDEKELAALFEKARKQNLIAIDFETDSLDAWNAHPVGISFALKPKEAYYVPVVSHAPANSANADFGRIDGELALSENSGDENSIDKNSIDNSNEKSIEENSIDNSGEPSPFIPPEKVRALLEPLLSDGMMIVCAHNAKYDYEVSRAWGVPRWKCRIWDTMVAAWVDDPERGNYSLDSLAVYYLNYTPVKYDDIVPKGCTFADVPLATACRYSAEDADLCLRMMRFLGPRLENASSLKLFLELEMPLLPILAEMEGEGIKIEKKALADYGVELAAEMKQIEKKVYKTVGHEFNLSSPKQLQEVLFTERGLTPGRRTKTGFSTDVDVLEALARVDEVPALILRHRTISKLHSTYIDALINLADSKGRIHTSFIQTGTATGRLSSRTPNLQNIPVREEEGRRIREAFVARQGHLLISADYSQIELVVLTHLSQDPALLDALRSNKDVHTRTAATIFGTPENKVTQEQRRMAKTINFGVMYGMSAYGLSNELGITRTEASAFIKAYFATYSGVANYIQELIKKTEEKGYASTLLGRRRYIPAINSSNHTEKSGAERIAVNTPIQGSAADIVKMAMLALDKKLAVKKSGAKLLLQVHDELILECPKEDADDTASLVRQVMESAVKLSVPLRVSVEKGRRWGDFH